MSGFYVDPAGLDGLYNVLHRASGDADDTLRYTIQHCELEFDERGWISIFAGSHESAYTRMTEALERLRALTSSAATQINMAQRDYAASDTSAAARLDQDYPGAQDPAAIRGMLATGRTDLWPTTERPPFSDVAEPARHLVPPNYATSIEMWQINPLTDLISPAAWLRQVSVWLFGHDPFEGWGSAFSGDWESYVHCAAAWRIVGNTIFDVGRNLTASAAGVPAVWRGQAAEAEQEFQVALGAAAMALRPACDRYADLYLQAAEAVKHFYAVITSLISKLIDVLIIVNLASVVGTATIETGIGAVAGYSVAAYYAWQAYGLYKEISKIYGNAETTFRGMAGTIAMVRIGLEFAALPDLKAYRHPAGYQG
ncbi:hypothetical protein BDK92_6413 [Micromonospora pisi]|uniref:Excreted virulence factor EspC (Type VII ESX diderm) n=2 Tax=Micromonospora pisi TaxID=589240 RepID=A0A495JUH5_9ACTN|nr:hypothetical protein BDK92_6413 [Micromonospora pisi]